jgi:general stress protein 26
MYETEAEMAKLDDVVEKSKVKSGDHVSSLFVEGEWISAKQVADYLQGIKAVALATVNAKLQPRVAPMEAILFHGRFYIAMESESYRVQQLQIRPSTSLTYTREDDVLITVHGSATLVDKGGPDFADVDAEWKKKYGRNVWDTVVFIRIEPTFIMALDINPELFPTA